MYYRSRTISPDLATTTTASTCTTVVGHFYNPFYYCYCIYMHYGSRTIATILTTTSTTAFTRTTVEGPFVQSLLLLTLLPLLLSRYYHFYYWYYYN